MLSKLTTAAFAALACTLSVAQAPAEILLDERTVGDTSDADLQGNYLAGQATHDYRAVGEYSDNGVGRWVLEFTLDAAAQAQIADATKIELVFTVQTGGHAGDALDLVAFDGTGTGENGTVDVADWEAGASLVQTLNPGDTSIAPDTTYTIDVTSLVKADASSGYTGFRVEQQSDTAVSAGTSNTIRFWSIYAADEADRPQLIVTVPEPGAAALGALGLVAVFARRR